MASKKAVVATPAKSTAMVKQQNTALAVAADVADLIAASAGTGSENIGRDDLAIPRIAILQSGSPQLKKADGKFLKGAEEGDFYDNVANVVLAKGETGFLFIPSSYRRANLEWIPQNKGGGFVADHGANDAILLQCTKDESNNMKLKNGHEIVVTAEYVGIVLDMDGNVRGQAAISLAKTSLKIAKRLNTLLTTLQVPRPNGAGTLNPAFCYSAFHVTTTPQSNDKGSWMGWNFARQEDTLKLKDGVNIFRAGLALAEAVNRGAVQVSAPEGTSANAGADDGETL